MATARTAPTCWVWPILWPNTCPTRCSSRPTRPRPAPARPSAFSGFRFPGSTIPARKTPRPGLLQAADDLDAFLDALMVDEDLLPEQVVLFGFSQGTMMALHVAPRREDPVAGIVAFSGRAAAAGTAGRRGGQPAAGPAGAWRCRRGGAAAIPAAGRRSASAGRLEGRLCPCDEGHGPRDRARRPVGGAGLHARTSAASDHLPRRNTPRWFTLCASAGPRPSRLSHGRYLRGIGNARTLHMAGLARSLPRYIVIRDRGRESCSGDVRTRAAVQETSPRWMAISEQLSCASRGL